MSAQHPFTSRNSNFLPTFDDHCTFPIWMLLDLAKDKEFLCCSSCWNWTSSSLAGVFKLVTVAWGMGESIGGTLHQSVLGHPGGTRFPRKFKSGRTGSGLHMTWPRCWLPKFVLDDVKFWTENALSTFVVVVVVVVDAVVVGAVLPIFSF